MVKRVNLLTLNLMFKENLVEDYLNDRKINYRELEWIYVNILDTKKLSLFQNGIHLWSVLYPAKTVK